MKPIEKTNRDIANKRNISGFGSSNIGYNEMFSTLPFWRLVIIYAEKVFILVLYKVKGSMP
jgi:hypothetical protein